MDDRTVRKLIPPRPRMSPRERKLSSWRSLSELDAALVEAMAPLNIHNFNLFTFLKYYNS